jgi:hypothetical protein
MKVQGFNRKHYHSFSGDKLTANPDSICEKSSVLRPNSKGAGKEAPFLSSHNHQLSGY